MFCSDQGIISQEVPAEVEINIDLQDLVPLETLLQRLPPITCGSAFEDFELLVKDLCPAWLWGRMEVVRSRELAIP